MAKKIPVAAENHHVQLGIGQLQARCKGDGTTMGRMVRVQHHIAGPSGGTADTGHHHGFFQINAAGLHGCETGCKGRTDAASGTPDVGNAVRPEEIVQRVGNLFFCGGHGNPHEV